MDNQSGRLGGGGTPTPRIGDRLLLVSPLKSATLGLLTASLLFCAAAAAADGNAKRHSMSPEQLRQFIDQQVGGIEKLVVAADNADLPQPLAARRSAA
jgi:hypothetical protein